MANIDTMSDTLTPAEINQLKQFIGDFVDENPTFISSLASEQVEKGIGPVAALINIAQAVQNQLVASGRESMKHVNLRVITAAVAELYGAVIDSNPRDVLQNMVTEFEADRVESVDLEDDEIEG